MGARCIDMKLYQHERSSRIALRPLSTVFRVRAVENEIGLLSPRQRWLSAVAGLSPTMGTTLRATLARTRHSTLVISTLFQSFPQQSTGSYAFRAPARPSALSTKPEPPFFHAVTTGVR